MGFTKEDTVDQYFFLWNLTDEALRNVEALKLAIRTASGMVRQLGGTCRLYVTIGGQYDLVGVAQGIDDTKAAELLLAVNGLRMVKTTVFMKAKNFSLSQYDQFVDEAAGLVKATPVLG